MTGNDLIVIGFEPGPIVGEVLGKLPDLVTRYGEPKVRKLLAELLRNPVSFEEQSPLYKASRMLIAKTAVKVFTPRQGPAPWKSWCKEPEEGALNQMTMAMELPVATQGALMPDAHQGYGLPIGGVLATKNAVVPYAVGVDIACRMRMSVFETNVKYPEELHNDTNLKDLLLHHTCFGTGASFPSQQQHDVLDENWDVTPMTSTVKDRAFAQLGSSGSGNHFVEWGTLQVDEYIEELALPQGLYLALLSHSGSRGPGAILAGHYTKLAKEQHPELPDELKNLAWFDLDSDLGQQYWLAMELMGKFAAANHAVIHQRIRRASGLELRATVENHHNFAWKENHNGEEVIVHRKGATPAASGILGVIPGSMAAPGFLVRGRGVAESLNSASHGAGRLMSRKRAKQEFKWTDVSKELKARKVTLLSAGLDENPFAYKNIEEVMQQQQDLVDVLARFEPRIVRMAEAGEKPED